MKKRSKNVITFLILGVTIAFICWLGLNGLKDAQELNEEVTFVSNAVANFKSDKGIFASVVAVTVAVASLIVPRIVKMFDSK